MIKGFYDNPKNITEPTDPMWMGIQDGKTLTDMGKISYENLVRPLKKLITDLAKGLLWQGQVIDLQSAPPLSPQDGARYIVEPPASGGWIGKQNEIATWNDNAGTWQYETAQDRWAVFVHDRQELWLFKNGSWLMMGDLGQITQILHQTEQARDDVLLDSGFIAVAEDLEGVNTIGIVAGDIDNVVIVGNNIDDVVKVADIDGDVTKVANIDAHVTAVADIDTDVTKVANIDAEVVVVADIDSEVEDVAGIKDDVETVAGIEQQVKDVAGIEVDVTTVAGIKTEVKDLAERKVKIDSLYLQLPTIAQKANKDYVDQELEATRGVGWDNTTIMDILSQYAVANGLATLDINGKIHLSQMPSLPMMDVHVVDTENEMLDLTANKGDVAIRTDLPSVFILSSENPTELLDWIELTDLQGAVDSALVLVKGVGWNGETIKETSDDLKAHKLSYAPHIFRNLKTGKSYEYGFQISNEGHPQLIYKEI
jgi:hypothetical protein